MKACVAICGEGGVGEFIVSRETRYADTMNRISSLREFFTNAQRFGLNRAARRNWRRSSFRACEHPSADRNLFFSFFRRQFFDRSKTLGGEAKLLLAGVERIRRVDQLF